MADIRPLHALHYDLRAIGSLGEVAAPPYDVISGPERSSMLDTSPFNVVEIDLPESTGGDPYEHASGTLEEWILSGILKQDREPSIWALTQEFTGPDGSMKIRNAILARVRVEDYGPGRIRPHERTQPGPKQDRLDLTRATRFNLSPIFSLTTRDAWPVVAPAIEGEEAWAEVLGEDGTLNRVWKIEDPEIGEIFISAIKLKRQLPDWLAKTNNRVFHAVNGQVQFKQTRGYLTSCGFPALKDRVVLIIDASNLSFGAHN